MVEGRRSNEKLRGSSGPERQGAMHAFPPANQSDALSLQGRRDARCSLRSVLSVFELQFAIHTTHHAGRVHHPTTASPYPFTNIMTR
jgi:hypothetical protein